MYWILLDILYIHHIYIFFNLHMDFLKNAVSDYAVVRLRIASPAAQRFSGAFAFVPGTQQKDMIYGWCGKC